MEFAHLAAVLPVVIVAGMIVALRVVLRKIDQ